MGEYETALNTYIQALKINPKSFYAYERRGYVKAALGNYEAAIRDYNQAIALNRDYAIAFYDRGIANIALGKYEAACGDFEQAVLLDPVYVDAINQLGNIKANVGNYQEAIKCYDQAIKLDSSYAGIIYDYIKSNPILAETPLHNYSKTIVLDLTVDENNAVDLQTAQHDISHSKSGKDSPSSPSSSPVQKRGTLAAPDKNNESEKKVSSMLAPKHRFFTLLSHLSDHTKQGKVTKEVTLTAPISISDYKSALN